MSDAHVVYKAVADFSALRREIAKTRAEIKALKAEEATIGRGSTRPKPGATAKASNTATQDTANAKAVRDYASAMAQATAAHRANATAVKSNTSAHRDNTSALLAETRALREQATAAASSAASSTRAASATARHSASSTSSVASSRRASSAHNEHTKSVQKLERATRSATSSGGGFTGWLGRLANKADAAGSAMASMFPTFAMLAAKILGIGGAIAPLIAGLGALAGAAVGAAGAIGQLSGAALALPGALGVLGTVIGTVKVAMSGMGEAFKAGAAASKASKAAAKEDAFAQKDRARAVRDAQRALDDARFNSARAAEDASERVSDAIESESDATRAVTEATKNVTEARKQATERLEELRKAVKRQADEELSARAGLLRSQEDYARAVLDPNSTAADIAEAQAHLMEASNNVEDVAQAGKKNAKDLAEANKKGIDGSDEVVAALEAESDAREALSDATRELARARVDEGRQAVQSARDIENAQYALAKALHEQAKGNQAAATAADAYKAALDNLSPSARKFVEGIMAMKPAWDAMRKNIQESFFKNLVPQLGNIRHLIGSLTELLHPMAHALGEVAASWIEWLASPGMDKFFESFGEFAGRIIRILGPGVLNIFKGLVNLMIAGQPAIELFAKWMVKLSETFLNWTSDTGHMSDLMMTALDTMKLFAAIIGNLVGAFSGIMTAAKPFIDWMLKGLVDMTQKWETWTKSTKGQNTMASYFESIKPLLTAFLKLIGAIIVAFAKIAADPKNIKQMTDMLNYLRTDILPEVVELIGRLRDLGFAPALLKTLSSLLKLLNKFLEKGGGGGLTFFIKLLGDFFDILTKLIDDHPKIASVLGMIAGGLAAIAAVRFLAMITGVNKLIKLFEKLTGFNIPGFGGNGKDTEDSWGGRRRARRKERRSSSTTTESSSRESHWEDESGNDPAQRSSRRSRSTSDPARTPGGSGRYVRTEAGARRYGVPIGSEIPNSTAGNGWSPADDGVVGGQEVNRGGSPSRRQRRKARRADRRARRRQRRAGRGGRLRGLGSRVMDRVRGMSGDDSGFLDVTEIIPGLGQDEEETEDPSLLDQAADLFGDGGGGDDAGEGDGTSRRDRRRTRRQERRARRRTRRAARRGGRGGRLRGAMRGARRLGGGGRGLRALKGAGNVLGGGGALGVVAQLGGGFLLDKLAGSDPDSKRAKAAKIGQGALSGASTGAMIGSVIPGVGTAVGGAIGGLVGGLYAAWKTLGTDSIKGFFASIGSKIADLGGWLSEKFKGVWDTVKSAIGTALTALLGFIKDHWMLLVGIFTGPFGLVVAEVIKHWDQIKGIFSAAWDIIKTGVSKAWEAIKWYFTTYFNVVKAIVTTVWNAIKAVFGAAWSVIKTGVSAAWGALKSLFSTGFNAVKAVVSSIWGGIKGIFTGAWSVLKSGATGAWDSIKTIFTRALDGIKTSISTALSGIKAIWNTLKTILREPVDFLVNTVLNKWIIGNVNKILPKVGVDKIPELKFATGGRVPGNGDRDTVPAMLTPGEVVIKKKSVERLGVENLLDMNERPHKYAQHFAAGGQVKPPTKAQVDAGIAKMVWKEDPNLAPGAGVIDDTIPEKIDKIRAAGYKKVADYNARIKAEAAKRAKNEADRKAAAKKAADAKKHKASTPKASAPAHRATATHRASHPAHRSRSTRHGKPLAGETVRQFQRRMGLVADGIVGPKTRAAGWTGYVPRRMTPEQARRKAIQAKLERMDRADNHRYTPEPQYTTLPSGKRVPLAKGGLVQYFGLGGWVKDKAKGAYNAVGSAVNTAKSAASAAADFARDLTAKGLGKLLGPVRSMLNEPPLGKSVMMGVPTGAGNTIIDKVLAFVSGKEKDKQASGNLGDVKLGDGSLGEPGNGDWPRIVDYLRHTSVGDGFRVNSTTGGQHANGSYHYSGRAVDFGPAGMSSDSAAGQARMMEIFKAFMPIAGSMRELFYTPAGFSIKDGHRTDPIAASGHYDHVHAAYAAGGLVEQLTKGMGGMLPQQLPVHRVSGARQLPTNNRAAQAIDQSRAATIENVHIHYPQPGASEDGLNKTMQKLSYLGVFG